MIVNPTDRVLLGLALVSLVLLALALFFAGLTFLLRWKNQREAGRWARLSQAWEPVLLGALSDRTGLPELLRSVEKGDELHFLEFLFQYAQRLEGSEQEILREAAGPYLESVVPTLEHSRMSHRARGVQTLGTLGLPGYAAELKRALADPSPFVAAIAGRLLAQEMGAEVARELCQSLDRFSSFRTWYLVDMLAGMGSGAVPALRETMLDRARAPRIRAVAAHALAVLRDPGSADAASSLIVREEDPELLSALFRLLAEVGTPAHSPAARAHLDSDYFFVRAAAARTLTQLGTEEDLPHLVELISDSSPWVRTAAARGIYRLGGKSVLTALARASDPAKALFNQVLAEEAGG